MIAARRTKEHREAPEVRTFNWVSAQFAPGAAASSVFTGTFTARSLMRIKSIHLSGIRTLNAGGAVSPNPVCLIQIVCAAQPGFINFPDGFATGNNQPTPLTAAYFFGPSSPNRKTNLRFAQGSAITLTLTCYDTLVLNDLVTMAFAMEWTVEANTL